MRPQRATYQPTHDPPPPVSAPATAQDAATARTSTTRYRTHARQHAHTASPHAPTPPSVRRYREMPATACPLCVRRWLPQTALPCNPKHLVSLGAAHCLSCTPHCPELNPQHQGQPASLAAPPPPRGHSSTPPRTTLGRHYAADPADHAWTIAMATGDTLLPLHSPPLRHSGCGWDMAAGHILLALYLHHCHLHLPDPTTPNPPHSSPGTGSVGGDGPGGGGRLPPTNPPPVQNRFRPAERNTLPLSALLYPAPPPAQTQADAPGGLGVLLGQPPDRPQRSHHHTDGPRRPARLRQGPRGMRQEGASLARPCLVNPMGTGVTTCPRHPPGQKGQDGRSGPSSAPASSARASDWDLGPATSQHHTSKAPGHGSINTLPNAHHHHRSATPQPGSLARDRYPHKSTPHRGTYLTLDMSGFVSKNTAISRFCKRSDLPM